MRPRRATWAVAVCVIGITVAGAAPWARQLPVLPDSTIAALPPPVASALRQAHDAAAAHPRDADAVGRLAMLLHAYEQLGLADACYRIAQGLDSQAFSWIYLSAVVRADLGEAGAAAAAYRRALELDRTYLPARLGLAESLMKAGDPENSRAEYQALVRDFPELALAHYGLGHVLSQLGDRRAAAAHHQRAVDLVPRFGAARYALALARRDLGMGEAPGAGSGDAREFAGGRPSLADPLLEQVRSMKGTARELIAEAARLGTAGRTAESIALHQKALAADPSAAQAHVNLISLYGRSGRIAEAEEHYRAALQLGANVADAHYNFGVLLASLRRDDEAAAAFRQALDVNPFHAQAHNNLAGILARRGSLDEAMEHYRQALANDPQYRVARFNLGRVLTAAGRFEEAIAQLQRVLEPQDADTPRYMFALAGAYRGAGDLQKAREYAQTAQRQAERLGQTTLAATIEKELRELGKVPR